MSEAWREMNAADGWRYVFYDDERADTWISRQLRGSEVGWAWSALRRGVLRADFLRYLVVLVQGGVVSCASLSNSYMQFTDECLNGSLNSTAMLM
jgi:alpha 1,6-mannosyltransferase